MDVMVFIEKVKKMRMHQNAYYRQGRKPSDLIASKQLEKEVDRGLLEGISFPVVGLDLSNEVRPTDAPKQNTLFE